MTPPTESPRPVLHTTEAFYASRPTAATVFLRTFLPWQLWRFVAINLRMLRVIALSHRSH